MPIDPALVSGNNFNLRVEAHLSCVVKETSSANRRVFQDSGQNDVSCTRLSEYLVSTVIAYPSKVPYDYETRKGYIDLPFPEEEYHERIRKIREMMKDHDLSGLAVYSYPSGVERAGHLTYLSGFLNLFGGDAVMLLPIDGEPTLIFDGCLHQEPMHSYIWTTWIKDVYPSTRDNLPFNIHSWIKDRDLENRRMGIVGEQMLPYDIWQHIRSSVPDVNWVKMSQNFNDIQKIKSEREMQLMRKVCSMTNEGMRAGVEAVTSGISESEIASKINGEIAAQGAHGLNFTSLVVSGPRAGLKHSPPTPRRVQDRDLIYIDIGAKYYGYGADMSRVVVVGNPNREQEEVLGYVRDAYYTILDVIKPGVSVTEICDLARELEKKTGVYEKYRRKGAFMSFSVSHGVSTGFFEWSLDDNRTIISPNLSPLAFEPMIVILGVGTIVIESMVEITQKGAEVLTPLSLDWM